MTATKARKELLTVKKAATEFLEPLVYCRRNASFTEVALLKDRAEKLVRAIADLGDGTRARLYSYLASHGHNWRMCYEMRGKIFGLFSASKYHWEELPLEGSASQASVDRINAFVRDTLPVLESIKNCDEAVLVPKSGRWGDPSLANLIAATAPVWHRVTNLAAAPNLDYDCQFAGWLESLLTIVGHAEKKVPVGLVLDVYRLQKNPVDGR